MKTGDIVLYIKRDKICVGILGIRWADKRWNVKSFRRGDQVVKRHEKFLFSLKDIKKYLDISNKI